MVEVSQRKVIDWYVVFEDGTHDGWWMQRLKPGFRHVHLVRYDGYNWIAVRPNVAYVDVEILPVVGFEPEQAVRGNVALYVRQVMPETVRTPWIVGPMTCVELVKAVLGIAAPHVLTPYQLYRYLSTRHGIETKGARADASATLT